MEIQGGGSKIPHQFPQTQTHLVPLTGNDCPSFGMMEQDTVVEERRVLEGRTAPYEVMGTIVRTWEPPRGHRDHHEATGTTTRR